MSTYAHCNDKPARSRPASPFQSSQPWPAASIKAMPPPPYPARTGYQSQKAFKPKAADNIDNHAATDMEKPRVDFMRFSTIFQILLLGMITVPSSLQIDVCPINIMSWRFI